METSPKKRTSPPGEADEPPQGHKISVDLICSLDQLSEEVYALKLALEEEARRRRTQETRHGLFVGRIWSDMSAIVRKCICSRYRLDCIVELVFVMEVRNALLKSESDEDFTVDEEEERGGDLGKGGEMERLLRRYRSNDEDRVADWRKANRTIRAVEEGLRCATRNVDTEVSDEMITTIRRNLVHLYDLFGPGVPLAQMRQLAVGAVESPPPNAREVCSICLGELSGGERTRILPCRHRFHVPCIDDWMSVSRTCPCCRFDVRRHFERAVAGTPDCLETRNLFEFSERLRRGLTFVSGRMNPLTRQCDL